MTAVEHDLQNPARPLRLYAERADLNDRAAGEAGAFDAAAAKIAAGAGPVVVPVCRYNFFRLDRVIAGLAERIGWESPPELPVFSPVPLAGSADRLTAYLAETAGLLRGAPIAIEPQPDTVEILKTLERALAKHTENTLLRILGILSETAFVGPEVFHLDFANACNVSCIYCGFHSPICEYDWKTPEWTARKLDPALFETVADDLAAMRAWEHIAVCGEGEPTVHPRFLEFLEGLKKRGLTIALYTNGVLLSPERMDRLVAMEADIVYCSISAGTPETYVALHPKETPADYHGLLSNLRYMIDRKLAAGQGKPHLIVRHVLTNRNYHELIDMVKQARDVGADSLMLEVMHQTGREADELLLGPMQIRELKSLHRAAEILCAKYGIRLTDHLKLQLDYIDEETSLWTDRVYEGRGCYAGWFFGRLYTNRAVSFCCQGKILGRLDGETSYSDLWFSDDYDVIRRKAKVFDPKDNHTFIEGGNLIAPGCARCGNYYTNEQYFQRIRALGLDRYLTP